MMDFCPFTRVLSSCPHMTKSGLCDQEIQCKKFKDVDIMGGKPKRCKDACKTCAKTSCEAKIEGRSTYCPHYLSVNISNWQHNPPRRSTRKSRGVSDPDWVLSDQVWGDYIAGSD
jgi:hypothetical protein